MQIEQHISPPSLQWSLKQPKLKSLGQQIALTNSIKPKQWRPKLHRLKESTRLTASDYNTTHQWGVRLKKTHGRR